MWISREELARIKKVHYETGEQEGRRKEREECKPFPDYYKERLEYWKGKFDKKPKPYRVMLRVADSDYEQSEDFKTFDDALARCNDVRAHIDNSDTFMFADKNWNPTHIVCCYAVSGHPSPYTPEEIEAWAKEKVEEEMKGWKVVKEDYLDDYQRHLQARLERKARMQSLDPATARAALRAWRMIANIF